MGFSILRDFYSMKRLSNKYIMHCIDTLRYHRVHVFLSGRNIFWYNFSGRNILMLPMVERYFNSFKFLFRNFSIESWNWRLKKSHSYLYIVWIYFFKFKYYILCSKILPFLTRKIKAKIHLEQKNLDKIYRFFVLIQ